MRPPKYLTEEERLNAKREASRTRSQRYRLRKKEQLKPVPVLDDDIDIDYSFEPELTPNRGRPGPAVLA